MEIDLMETGGLLDVLFPADSGQAEDSDGEWTLGEWDTDGSVGFES